MIFGALIGPCLSVWVRRLGLRGVILNGGPGGVLLARRQRSYRLLYYGNHTYREQARVPGECWKSVFEPIEARAYRRSDVLVACSRSTRRCLSALSGRSIEEIPRIPVGVDVERFRPGGQEEISRSILFVGRLELRKGVDFLLDALPRVRRAVPDVRVFLAGRGRERSRLVRRCSELGLADHVAFLGPLSEDELTRWYGRCQVQVVPSLFEGLGIVALEAMASGLPVVATRGSGLEDAVRHRSTGFLVDHGDHGGLAHRLVSLLSRPGLLRKLGTDARRHVVRNFSWEVVLDRWEVVLRGLLEWDRESAGIPR